MKNITGVVTLMLLLFAVPAQAQTLTDAQKAEIEKILTDATKEIVAAVNQLSAEGYAKYLSSDFQERLGGGNINATGRDALLQYYESNNSQRTSMKSERDLIRVHVLSQDLAYVVDVGALSVTTKSGRHGGYGNAITRIWRKEPGGWKIIHMHESVW